jgi:hypothetical protein
MANVRGIVRQGDVILLPVESIPKAARPIKPVGGLYTVAWGEATNHHHSIPVLDRPGAAPTVTAFVTDLPDGKALADAVDIWLRVDAPGVQIEHQEHAALPLPPGLYKAVRPVEYVAGELRRVAD